MSWYFQIRLSCLFSTFGTFWYTLGAFCLGGIVSSRYFVRFFEFPFSCRMFFFSVTQLHLSLTINNKLITYLLNYLFINARRRQPEVWSCDYTMHVLLKLVSVCVIVFDCICQNVSFFVIWLGLRTEPLWYPMHTENIAGAREMNTTTDR